MNRDDGEGRLLSGHEKEKRAKSYRFSEETKLV
jgi:hypothetical protein